MSSLFLALLFLLGVHHGSSLQCISNHEYDEGGKHITMTKASCSSRSYCAYVHFKDTIRREVKQGFAQGCDYNNIDCGTIDTTSGWTETPDGRAKCKNIKDFGNRGYICCCASDNCNMPIDNPRQPKRPVPTSEFPYFLTFLTIAFIITAFVVVSALIFSRRAPVKQ